MPLGFVLTTLNLVSPNPSENISSMLNMSPNGVLCLFVIGAIMSPFVAILPSNARFTCSGDTCMTTPFSAGANVIFFASMICTGLIVTFSPIEVSAFFLMSPSMRTMFRDMSAGYGRTAIAPVFRLPSTSTMSPSCMSSSLMRRVSKRTMPVPISDWALEGISPTFS